MVDMLKNGMTLNPQEPADPNTDEFDFVFDESVCSAEFGCTIPVRDQEE